MKINAINNCQNAAIRKTNPLNKAQNVAFGAAKFPENGWSKISGVSNYKCFDGVWSVPSMITLGFLHRNELNVYSEDKKPIIAYLKQNDGSLHCLFGNGSYYPYAWVYFCADGKESINKILNDDDYYTAVTEKDEMVDGVKLSRNNNCTVCQKSVYYPSDWGDKETCVPSRYLEILKKHLEDDK